ncbi:hypothetical protein KC207_04800 [Phycicoccus sp. BSK3Z-2]|uniref:Uncharacterized protein n=1 Tax=Phycicoccus avicenniae TaxID=2828860 RepID=A0A941D5P8_9MICO|nr:DUF6270 domain-containing protein [Phycicoccus avicenniae]MBR7742604.1 hypothetical protein [Phycicoccus avicenniae]
MKVLIYGSCVSRDTFELLPRDRYALLDYVARQSLISAFSPVDTQALYPFEADSAFQRRMLHNDWRASLASTVESTAGDVDVLLWDLCDERLGVRHLPSGGYVTRSVDLVSTGVDARLRDEAELLDLGSSRHRRLWWEGLGTFRDLLERTHLLEKTVLVAPPWAARTVTGEPSPTSFGRSADEANELFDEYHRWAVEGLGCPVVSLAPDDARSDSTHRWGLAPFHYARENYVSLATQIDAVASARSGRTSTGV